MLVPIFVPIIVDEDRDNDEAVFSFPFAYFACFVVPSSCPGVGCPSPATSWRSPTFTHLVYVGKNGAMA